MRKRKASYLYKSWKRYGLGRQCVLLLFCVLIWIGLAFSVAQAGSRGKKGPLMTLDDQMAVLNEKLQLTADQQPHVRAVLEQYREKKRDLIRNRTGSGEEMRKKIMTLHSEEENQLATILSDSQMEAFTAFREEQRATMRQKMGERRGSFEQ